MGAVPPGSVTLYTDRPIGGIDVTTNIYTAVVERCPDTGLYVGYIPGFPGAHSQGETLDELNANLKEVVAMILDDGEPPSRLV